LFAAEAGKVITIFKYKIRHGFYTPMPRNAKPLSVGQQGSDIMCWALVDDEAPFSSRKIAVIGTGHPADCGGEFIGTVQMDSGLVWHLFDCGEESGEVAP
jgi:hypothetical protein